MKRLMTLDTLNIIASEILEKVRAIKFETATVISLSGELGSGKTTLTQQIAKDLGVKGNITSPTFVIMKKYEVKDKKFKQLIHIDAYRLNKSSELLHLGWQELLKDKSNLILIEWPTHVPECIPEDALCLELAHDKEHTRTLEFRG